MANNVLAEDEFNIVMMYAIGGYKHKEIAEFLHMPLGTVTWKYATALKKLRKALADEESKYALKRQLQSN